MENLNDTQRRRIVEIAFYELFNHMRSAVPNEKFFLFLEAFCRSMEVDYTSITIAVTQFVKRLKPSNPELTLLAVYSGVKLKSLGLDYRTIRTHKKKLETGDLDLYPRILNRFLIEDLRKFVIAYLRLFPYQAPFLHEYYLKGGFDEAIPEVSEGDE